MLLNIESRRKVEKPAMAVPDGFLLKGRIRLFGLIPATLYSFQGKATENTFDEMVILSDDLSLGELIPSLRQSALGGIHLKSSKFTYTKFYKPNLSRGLRFETDLTFEGELECVSCVLKKFNQTDPALRVSGLVAPDRNWNSALVPGVFTLRGSFERISVKLGNIIEFKSVGVELITTPAVRTVPSVKRYHRFSYGFFGTALLTVPASVITLSLRYYLRKDKKLYSIHLYISDDEWKDVCGVLGLNLSEVQFFMSFTSGAPCHSLFLKIQATMDIKHAPISLSGSHSPGRWGLQGTIQDVDMSVLGGMFRHVFGAELQDFTNHNIAFSDLELNIGTNGLALTGALTIDHYTATKATIEISRTGMTIKGSVENVRLDFLVCTGFKGIELKMAALNVSIGKVDHTGQKSAKVVLEGKVSFADREFGCGLFWQKVMGQPSRWTVYGEFASDMMLSGMSGGELLKGTFLDFSIKDVAFLASNTDISEGAFAQKFKYDIKKGVQLCATIDHSDVLNHFTGSKTSKLILSASFGTQLTLSIAVTETGVVSFGQAVTAGPLVLEIQIAAVPSLIIHTELRIQLPKWDDPLVCTCGLKADEAEASGFVEILHTWNNPFGISPRLTIGPKMGLQLGIVYAGGIPTIGFNCDLKIGNTKGSVAFQLSENPMDELLNISIRKFELDDLIDFASDITGVKLHYPPQDMLRFHGVDRYISSGVLLSTHYYPKGVKLKASLDIFGKKALISCELGKALKVKGSVDEFQLGPLYVSGTGANHKAVVDIELGQSVQHILVNGVVDFLHLDSVLIDVEVELLPDPKFKFNLELDFTDIFKFILKAEMNGKVNFDYTSKLDFTLYALLSTDICKSVENQVKRILENARKVAKAESDTASNALDAADGELDKAIDIAQTNVNKARLAWEKLQADVNTAFKKTLAETPKAIDRLIGAVTRAEAIYNAALETAHATLVKARRDAKVAILSATENVERERTNWDAKIVSHERNVSEAKENVRRDFGDALQKLEDARGDVAKKGADVEGLERQIQHLSNEMSDAPWYTVPGLSIEIAAMTVPLELAQGTLWIAEGVLKGASAIVEGAEFVTANGAIGTYQRLLGEVHQGSDTAMEGIEAALEEVNSTQAAIISAADEAVTLVKIFSDELKLFNNAKDALELAKKAAPQILAAAQDTVDGLAKAEELTTFNLATTALNIAKNDKEPVILAHEVLTVTQETEDAILRATEVIVDRIFQITKLEMKGDLRAMCVANELFTVEIEGEIGGESISFTVEFRIGGEIAFLQLIYEWLLKQVKSI